MTGRGYIVMVIVAVALSAAAVHARAQATSAPADTVAAGLPLIAVLPFANNTGIADAEEFYMGALHGALGANRLTYVTAASIRPLLREHRIRSRGWISRRGAEIIAAETGVRYLMLGSWDVLRSEGNVEVGFSVRVLDTASMALSTGISAGGTGEDHVGWLDLGRVDDVVALADTVMVRAIRKLVPFPEPPSVKRSWRGCNQLAVIPFDNFSDTRHAGDMVTNIVLSRLLAAGYFVVEPGFVRELGLARETVVVGGVDRASARTIDEVLGACRVITGAVEQFRPSFGLPSASVPELAVSIRVTVTESGNLYMIRNFGGAGDDKQRVFHFGRVHALIPLADRVLQSFAQDLAEANREDILHGPQRDTD